MADETIPNDQSTKRRRRFRIAAVGMFVALLLVAGNYAFWRYHIKRFQVVAPGVLYRSAQPTEFALSFLAKFYGVKTVVSLQLFDFRLYSGVFDPGEPDGAKEAGYVRSLGLQDVQWPMGEERYWPWPTPWQFEEFFRLVDDPANHPILIHCMGGRHRTGTMSALYRLEYDRWTPEAALAEMYSYPFGLPVCVQEYNLRTYVPRPLPNDAQSAALRTAFAERLDLGPTATYAALVQALRSTEAGDPARNALADYVRSRRPFALPLAARIIDSPDDPLAAEAAATAAQALDDPEIRADRSAVVGAAALVADFGAPADQQFLLDLLQSERTGGEPTPFYEALVAGVTNRYTPNRIAFLRPLLTDERVRPGQESVQLRYCDTAVVRLAAITDELPVERWDTTTVRVHGPREALAWFDENPQSAKLSRLLPAKGNKVVLIGDGPQEEDLSKMRR